MHRLQVKAFIQQLRSSLTPLYDDREANNIAQYLLESIIGKEALRNNIELTAEQLDLLNRASARLQNAEPVQYVTNEAWFYGLSFYVDHRVLIPRPETEELAEMVIKNHSNKRLIIIDIGTGSGCIPIAIKKKIPHADLYATDISTDALEVAKINAAKHQMDIHFILHDILSKNELPVPTPDVIVSNPPYIHPSDKASMHLNVTAHEPHSALFSPDDDQLIYYKRITEIAAQILRQGGSLYFEIPEMKGEEIKSILQYYQFDQIIVHRDLQGKNRFVSAIKNTNIAG